MEATKSSENDRAFRIAFRLNTCHDMLTEIYENLVDREYAPADKDVRVVIMELRFILKSIEEDDF